MLDSAVNTTPIRSSISALTSSCRTSSRFFSAMRDQFRLCPLKISVCLTAWRLPPLAPQESQVGNAVLIERKAAAITMQHAFGFKLMNIRPTAIQMQRQR